MAIRLLITIIVLCIAADLRSQTPWKEMHTVAEVLARYPGRVDSLMKSLEPGYPGLEKIQGAYNEGDVVAACNNLIDYYRRAKTAKYYRKALPSAGVDKNSKGDSILQDIFTFYDIADRVPRLADGRLHWAHEGPDEDIEWAWGLNRHGHLMTLLDAYHQTGNAVYAERINDHIQDWIVGSLPYPRVKSSTAQWRGLEVALRAKVWVRIFFALQDSEFLTPATRLLMLTSLPEHIHYLKNFHAPAGNWLTMEMSSLAMVSTSWPEFRGSAACVAYAKQEMLAGLKDQVYPDGVQKELTSHYHYVALANFDQFREICEQAGEPLPDEYTTELEKMHSYLAYTMRPSGHGILNNDSDLRYNRDIVLKAAGEYGREDWLFIASNGIGGKRPEGNPSRIFPWAGQLITRSDYDADAHWAFFDIGPWGTGHQHNDKLHISVSAFGRDLLVDGGRFAYRGELADKFRKYAVGSSSHNVVLPDGAGQGPGPRVATEPLSEKHFRITERFDYAWNAFDDFENLEGKVKHTRAMFYVRGKFWIVVDRIDTDRPRNVEALWHWHPALKINEKANGIIATESDRGNLQVIPVGKGDWKISQARGLETPSPQGWYSERYNKAEPSTVSIYSSEIEKPSTFVWILQPSEKQAPPLRASIVSQNGEKVVLRVTDRDKNAWVVTVPFSNSAEAAYEFASARERKTRTGKVEAPPEDVRQLLSRLALDAPGMERVKASAGQELNAADALLAYYRGRTHIRHFVDRTTKTEMRGRSADEKDLQIADDALQHRFVGQSAYPAYYCGDDINWGYRPVPDNEWVWQLNRMGFWEALGKAYWHTGEEKYAREWVSQLIDWTQKNPRDDEHGYAWRSIEAGIRGYRWTGLFQRFVDAPSFTPDALVAFLNSCYDHAEYLMTKYRKGSNWGLMEAEGMAFIAIMFPEFKDAEKWRHEAFDRLIQEISTQVYPDGHQRELAMGYHTGSIGWFLRTLDLAEMNGLRDAFPKTYLEAIERMCEVPFKLGLPDGSTTQFGDSWSGEPGRIWPMLGKWADRFDRGDFRFVATQGRTGKQPKSTAFALEHSGFYSMRSAWDSNAICLVMKCGPDGGGHCQPDNGTFELYAGGRHLMPDAGSYIYSSNPEGRAWFRQTKVHQTLTLNGENTAYAPSMLLWKPGRQHDVVVVQNESYPGLTHRRAVIFVDKKYFVIVDEAIGTAKGDVDIHFQLGPGDAVVDQQELQVQSAFDEGWNVMVKSMPQRGLQLEEEEGWVSFIYTQKEPRPAFRYRLRKPSPQGVRFITVVAPYSQRTPPKISAEPIGNPQVGASRISLKVSENGVSKKITYVLKDTPAKK